MSASNLTMNNLQHWNLRLIKVYWIIISFCFAWYNLFFFMELLSRHDNYYTAVLQPNLLLILIISLATWSQLRFPRISDYIIIAAACLLNNAIILMNPDVDYLLFSLFLPILVSVYYFHKNRVFFALCISWISLCIIYLLEMNNGMKFTEFTVMSIILISFTFISLGIMNRGIELEGHLNEAFEASQELLVKNIIMDKLSKIDALTELYNHITFQEYLGKLIEQSEMFSLPLQMAVLDIDNFKKINDTYGHRAGDLVLKRVAQIIKDNVSPNDFVARYGGEEFAIIFTEKLLEEAYSLVEHIRQILSDTKNEELNGNSVTISIGLSQYYSGIGKETFFEGVDASLYRAKRSGKNCTIVSDALEQIVERQTSQTT